MFLFNHKPSPSIIMAIVSMFSSGGRAAEALTLWQKPAGVHEFLSAKHRWLRPPSISRWTSVVAAHARIYAENGEGGSTSLLHERMKRVMRERRDCLTG